MQHVLVIMNYSNFFIKDGYVCNHAASTYEYSHVGEYWTKERIRQSSEFQYHVYALASRIAKTRGFKIGLDLGCGPARKTEKFLVPYLSEIFLLDQPNLKTFASAVLPNGKFIGVDLEVCGVALERCVDLIVCADVLEHLHDPTNCLKFVFDHLAPDGVAVFSTPERDFLRGRSCLASSHPSHVREWNRKEFRQLLEYYGFKVIRQTLFPAARIPAVQDFIRSFSIELFMPNRWKSCQVAVCSK